jgi:MraZ protein
MFIGEYQHSVDDKGRVAIPGKFRSYLASGAVVTRGLDNCLVLYTKEEWSKMAEKLSSLPLSQQNARAFARLMLAGAMDVEMDKQGRIILPSYLKQFAGITKEVIIAGLFNRLEIWSADAWKEYRGKAEKDSNNIAEQLGALGI